MTNEEIATKLTNHEQRIVGVEHRTKDLEESQKQIYDLTISVKELAISVKGMVEEQKEQGKRIDRLEREPAEKWHTMQKTFLTSVVSAVAGALVSGLIFLIARYI